jgi:hypothetical protein
MSLSAAKKIAILIFVFCAFVFPAVLTVSLWLAPTIFAKASGEAVCGYFTLIVGAIATLSYMAVTRHFADYLCLEFCRAEKQLEQPVLAEQRNRAIDLIEAIQMVGGARTYYWFLVPLALAALAFYGAALLIDLYLAFAAATLPLVFVALAVLASSLTICLALPSILFAHQHLEPAAILARFQQEIGTRHR